MRVMARARSPAGPWRAPELVVAARHHTGGFRAAPPVATRQRHWRRWRKGPEPSQWLLGSPITRTAAGQKQDLRRLLHTGKDCPGLSPTSEQACWLVWGRAQAGFEAVVGRDWEAGAAALKLGTGGAPSLPGTIGQCRPGFFP